MRNLRNFGITFAVSLVILGIIAIIAAQYVAGAVTAIFDGHQFDLNQILQPTETAPNSDTGADDKFTRELEGETFTWLMVIYDQRTDVYDYYPTAAQIKKSEENGILGKDYSLVKAKTIALVHANVEKREYVVMNIPSITKVETGVGDYTLAEVYGIYGLDYLRDKISSMTGLEIDYYTAINAIDLPSVVSAIGDIHIDVPVEIGFNGKEYVTYVKPPETEAAETKKPKPDDEKKDEETEADTEAETEAETEPVIAIEVEAENGFKDPKKLHAVMLYSDYSDGIEHESAIINGFVASVLNNISSSSDNSLENIIRGLEKKMTTNITAEDIALNGDVVRAYSWLGKQYVVYPGRLVSASANKDAFYLPDVNEAMEFFYKYR